MNHPVRKDKSKSAHPGVIGQRKTDLVKLYNFRLLNGEIIEGADRVALVAVAADILVNWTWFQRRNDGKPYLSANASRKAEIATVGQFHSWFWDEDEALVSHSIREREAVGRSYTHEEAGFCVNLQILEAQELHIGSMHPRGETREERKARQMANKRRRDRERRAAQRHANGATPREQSLSARKPWETLGISRATYYRRRSQIETERARTVLYKFLGD